MKDGTSPPKRRTNLCITTDAGSDERAMRDAIAFLCALVIFVYYWENNCWQHQLHIVQRGLLSSVDVFLMVLVQQCGAEFPSTSYFSCLATWSNSIREYSSKLKNAILFLYPLTPVRVAGKLPPRCLTNRWLCVVRFQRHILFRSFELMRDATELVFVKRKHEFEEVPLTPVAAGAPVDEDATRETASYFEKVGRWRKASIILAFSRHFRLTMRTVQGVQFDHLVGDLFFGRFLCSSGFVVSLVVCC